MFTPLFAARPHTSTTRIVANLGMHYIYIPVDFENPTTTDFATFCDTVESVSHTQIHCIYNARVTAFFYWHAQIDAAF